MALTENVRHISPHATAARRAQSPARSTVLIAEDDADSREMMAILLRLKGFRVIGARDGVEAVELAMSNSLDLILLDYELPGCDGLSVVRSLRTAPNFVKTPIVILSGHDPAVYRQTALDAGCSEYLVKPIDFDTLDVLLDRMIAPNIWGRKAD